jgi:predicted transposase/invertase (TIGR01784 family)
MEDNNNNKKKSKKKSKNDKGKDKDILDINNNHDIYIQKMLGKIENVRSFLENYLPKELIPLLDLDYLELFKDKFVDEKLNPHLSDLIFKTKTKTNKKVFIYTLFEHKSFYDKYSVLQLLKYMALCYEKIKSKKMPIIIPLLIYHGKKEWKSANNLNHLFKDIDEEFRKYIPNFNFELYDIIKEQKIVGNNELKLLIVSFIYRLYPERKELLERVNFLYLNKNTLSIFLIYLLSTTHENNKDYIIKMLKEKIKEEDIMSIADSFRREGIQIGEKKGIQRGREEGIQIGEEKGLEKGLEKGKEEIVKNMLLKGLDAQFISEITSLSVEKINEIKNSLDK